MKFKLNSQEILEKEFKITMKGYSQEEVDNFLDVIIEDYDAFEEKINSLNAQILQLNDQIRKLSLNQQQASADTKEEIKLDADILQRLAKLENAVYNKE